MLEICLKNKIIYDFLQNYKQKKWSSIIPSLLEISILNLYSSFKRYIFSEEDLSLIIENLKSKYFQLLQVGKYLKSKKILNSNREKINIDIPKFRKNLKLNLQDYLQGRNDSYRSFTKKPKNINELNIYSNNIKDNKKNHYYNRSSVVTPIKRLINYNETDVSVNEDRYKNIFKINKLNKRVKKNNFKFYNNNNEKKIIEYNTIDHYDYNNDTYQSIFNTCKNMNKNMNYSYSIDYKKNKNYIKVNKNNNTITSNKLFDNNFNNEEEKIMKKDNKYKEINDKPNKINRIAKLKIINDYKKKYKNNFNLLTNFNKDQILKLDENKKKLSLNNINYYKEKYYAKTLSKTANSSMVVHNSPKKNFDNKGISKLQKYINNHHQLNININKINLKDFKNIQITSIKKNLKNIILNKEKKKENHSNKNLIEDINKSIPNLNDINNSIGSNNILKINEQGAFLFKNNKRKKIINYNSFNNSKNSKNSISLNDPYLFIKSPRTKKFILGKKLNYNANGKDTNS